MFILIHGNMIFFSVVRGKRNTIRLSSHQITITKKKLFSGFIVRFD